MSLIGKKISEFKTMAYHNGEFKEINSESLKGKWAAIVFYPADFTFVCPTELEDLAENYDKFKAEGCEIYSVSTDTHFVHKAWHDSSKELIKYNIPMLSRSNWKIS